MKEAKRQPMLLHPVGKDYLWGGNRLKEKYEKKIALTPLAETWECSVHPDGPSVIASGEYKGLTLAQLLDEHPEYMGSKVDGEFPILVKFIDAEKDLSVQVHPDDKYARIHENQNVGQAYAEGSSPQGRCVLYPGRYSSCYGCGRIDC